MTANQPIAPYRTAAPREQEPRPLAPEQEMRLLLDAGALPRGARAWSAVASAVLGAAVLVWNGLHLGAFAAALYVALPASTALTAWLRHRRRLARLRREGFDVTPVTAQLRVALEPRVRIAAAVEPPREPAERDLDEGGDATDMRASRRSPTR